MIWEHAERVLKILGFVDSNLDIWKLINKDEKQKKLFFQKEILRKRFANPGICWQKCKIKEILEIRDINEDEIQKKFCFLQAEILRKRFANPGICWQKSLRLCHRSRHQPSPAVFMRKPFVFQNAKNYISLCNKIWKR